MPSAAYAAQDAVETIPGEPPAGAVELPEKRTATTKHYRLTDGTMQAVISEAPVHYRASDGTWEDIDPTLVPATVPGHYQTRSTAYGLSVGRETVSDAPVTLSRDGWSVGIDLVGASEGNALAVGRTARYPQVIDGVDLVYETGDDGLKETIVLASADVGSSFGFEMKTEGASLKRDFVGGWTLFDDAGDPVMGLGGLCVFDSSENEAGDPAYCDGASMDVVPTDGGALVTYTVPQAWLDDPGRAFPVYVDPTLSTISSLDTFVSSRYTTTSYNASTELKCGYYDSTTGHNRTLVKFDTSSIPTWARVDSTVFSIYQYHTYYVSSATTTYLGKLTSNWGTSTTWSTRPSFANISSKSVSGRGVWVNWDSAADTDIKTTVANWVASPAANYGFMCYQLEDGSQNTTHWRKFYSREYATSTYRPKLVVNYTSVPDPVTTLAASSNKRAFEWYREVDRDGDGVSDTPNDLPGVGRGAVDLSWSATARAAGYDVFMYDGDSYEKVGTVFGAGTTSWSSEGCGIYPTDSEIASWSVASRNMLTRAASPRANTKDDQITVPGQSGAGLVTTDGTYLYVRRWGSYAGPSAWMRVGTGLNGTVKGQDYGTVGPDLSAHQSLSAFYLDGFIYDGYATSATTIEGVWKGAAEGSTEAKTLTFSPQLVKRSTGGELSGASNDVLLTCDGDYIYNIAYGINGVSYAGYTIKVYEEAEDGTWQQVRSTTIPMTSDYLDGVFCDGEALYLLQWNNTDSAHVTKVRTSDLKIANQWPINQNATSVISGCYDPSNDVFWLGSLFTGTIYRYLGPGLDLRDTPEPMYEKGTQTGYWNNQNYWFRVVPFNVNRESAALASCDAYMPTLENRTVGVNDDPRHTTADLGEAAGHTMTAVLDEGALEVAVTDLSIASFGPVAALSRHYSSSRTSAGLLAGAPGWRFDFQRGLEFGASTITYRDETGEGHVFTLEDGTYFAPNGEYSSLVLDGSTYVLTHKDFSRDVFSATTGALLASYDQSGNALTYTKDGDTLTIGAANGQSIVVGYEDGVVASAVYATEDGTRTVSYATTGTPSVTYFDGAAGCEYAVAYAYTDNLLSALTIPDYPESGTDAVWSFSYASGKISSVQRPADAHAHTDIAYTTSSATLATHGDVGSATSSAATQDADIETHYAWNPTGTMASMTDPHLSAAAHSTWTYTYGPTNEAVSELSPSGKTISRELDSRGNVLYEWDEEGHRTAYRYDELDQLVRSTDPRGQATYYTYGTDRYMGSGMLEAEEKVLTAAGARSRTEYDYDTAGRTTEERSLVSGSEWAITRYSGFAPCGEAGTITNVGVRLSSGGTPQDLVTTKSFDAFGNVLSETDAASVTTAVNTYDIAGRQMSSQDATGTSTISAYDVLGNATASRRETSGGTWSDRTSKDYDAAGHLVAEYFHALDASGTIVVDRTLTHTYDASGRESASDDSKVTGSAVTFYDARGVVVKAWTEGSDTTLETASTRSVYDVYGQLTSELAPGADTSATAYSYLPNGLTSRVDNPDGSYTAYTYDDGGLKTSEVTPVEGGGTATATFSYDVGGRLVSSTTADGATTTYGYDLLGRQVSAAAGGATASTTVYNTLGWVLSETDSDGVVKSKTYDACGRVLTETEAAATTAHAYDDLGQLTVTEKPDGSEIAVTFDALGQQVASEQRASDDTVVSDVASTYDEQGRIKTMVDAAKDTSSTLSYASDGSTTIAKQVGGAQMTTVIDSRGLALSQSLETTGVATIERELGTVDAALRPTSWATDTGQLTVAYDQAGRVAADTALGSVPGEPITEPSGGDVQIAGLPPAGVNFTYDPATGRKTGEEFIFTFGGTEESSSYSYTSMGRLASADIGGTNTTYAYELGSGNLTGMTRSSETTTFTYGEGNRLASMSGPHGTVTYGWDTTRGWRTSAQSSGQSAISFAYDDAGRLTSYTDPNTDTAASHLYDAEGQRVRSVLVQGSVTTTTTYVYEGLLLQAYTAERSDGATSSLTYLYDEQDDPIAGVYASSETSSVAFTVISTDRGDVRELQDASGASFAFYAYDAYGNLTATLSAASASVDATLAATIAEANVLRYAGYCFDEFSGMYYLSQRYYDPATCQFITKDPAKADGEESAYQYCGGDPVGKVDPSGAYSLNAQEKALKKRRWWEFPYFLIAGQRALDRARKLFPTSLNDGKGDAFRHAYWNAVLARYIGVSNTKRWTDAHEYGDPKNSWRCRTMDLHNNGVGRDYAFKTRNSLASGKNSVSDQVVSRSFCK